MNEMVPSHVDLSALLDQVVRNQERVVVHASDGSDVAALIPIEELRLLERLIELEEDRIDIEDAERILADPNEERIPAEEVQVRLGLSPPPVPVDGSPVRR